MPGYRRVAFLALALLLPLWGPSCGDDQSAPVAGALEIVSGDGQSAEVGTSLSQQVVVRVTDDQGTPTSGIQVSWNVTAGGGSVTPAQSQSGSDGRASTTWTLGTSAGQQGLRASADGAGSVTFTATGLPGSPASLTLSAEELEFDGIGQTETLTATVKDEHGNTIASPDVSYASSDEAVVTVDDEGVVTSEGEGDAEITATSGSASATVPVTVELARFEPAGDTVISGDVQVPEMTVAEGVTVTVAGSANLTVTGAVAISGSIAGDCQALALTGGGDVTITGTVSNACSTPSADPPGLTISATGALDLSGAEISSDGDITISNTGGAAVSRLAAAGFEPLLPTHGGGIHDCLFSGTRIRPLPTYTMTVDMYDDPPPGADVDIFCSGHLALLTPTVNTGWGARGSGQLFEGEGDYPSGTAVDGSRGGDFTATGNTVTLEGGEYNLGGGGHGGDWYANGTNPESFGGDGGRTGQWLAQAALTSTVVLPPRWTINRPGHGGDATAVGDVGSDAFAEGGDAGSVGEEGGRVVSLFESDFERALDEHISNIGAPPPASGGMGHVIPGDGPPGTFDDIAGGDAGAGTAFGGTGSAPGAVLGESGDDVLLGEPGGSGGILFEGATGGPAFGSCAVNRPDDRAGVGGNGGVPDGAPGQPGSRGDVMGTPGPIIFHEFGHGGAGGPSNTPGSGGSPGSNPFSNASPPPIFEGDNFLPGPRGDDCLRTMNVTMTTTFDPAGHGPFTRYESVSENRIRIFPPEDGDGGPTISIEGDGPWVPQTGGFTIEVNPINDPPNIIPFTATGRGTVAGFPDIRVNVFTATLSLDDDLVPNGLNGEVEVGADGGLPGGEPQILDIDALLPPPQAPSPPAEAARGGTGGLGVLLRPAVRVPLRPDADARALSSSPGVSGAGPPRSPGAARGGP